MFLASILNGQPALWGQPGVDDALINLLTGTTSVIPDAGKIHIELILNFIYI